MEDIKTDFTPKNLRVGCHFFNGIKGDDNLFFDVYTANELIDKKYIIPLRKEVLEPLGFEAVYDEYSSEIYFQRDYKGYRLRTFPMDGRIDIIDLKYLHTVVSTKAEALHELENFLVALDVNIVDLVVPGIPEINDFGKRYFAFYEEHNKMLEDMYNRSKIKEEE